MSLHSIMAKYPIGTRIRLLDDDPDTIRQVHGYEWFGSTWNIILRDGGKLNMARLELIVEVEAA